MIDRKHKTDGVPSGRTTSGADRSHLSDVIRWALEVDDRPEVAAANWLARDIDPTCETAVELLTRSGVPLEHRKQAKQAFKTMRMIGETPADRRLGGQLYLAAIASALVHDGSSISRQSNAALVRALKRMIVDSSVKNDLRVLAKRALAVLERNGEIGRQL
jgi:hypothetical protein